MLLDDTLSALDRKTEDLVVERLLSRNGLFKKLGTTVVLVTHARRHLALADKIVVLDQGAISYEGPFEGGYNRGVLEKGTFSVNAHQSETTPGTVAEKRNPAEEAQESYNLKRENMDRARQTGDLQVYAYYLRSAGWLYASILIGCCILLSFTTNFPSKSFCPFPVIL